MLSALRVTGPLRRRRRSRPGNATVTWRSTGPGRTAAQDPQSSPASPTALGAAGSSWFDCPCWVWPAPSFKPLEDPHLYALPSKAHREACLRLMVRGWPLRAPLVWPSTYKRRWCTWWTRQAEAICVGCLGLRQLAVVHMRRIAKRCVHHSRY